MTTSKAAERDRRGGPPATGLADAVYAYLAERCRVTGAETPGFPLLRYQRDPLGFVRDVLGVALMDHQEWILLAIAECSRVAVSGGRKTGKDFVVACAALWYFACFPDARVQFTAVTDRQVNRVFWRQIVALLNDDGRCVDCKRAGHRQRPCPHSVRLWQEAPPTLARTGLLANDQRELVGYTAQEAAANRGLSGINQFYIVDEASDAEDDKLAASLGNLSGSQHGKMVLLSNPTRNEGTFYRAFHGDSAHWRTFQLNSVEIAKRYGGRVPGVAVLAEIEKLIAMWGEESDLVQQHLYGHFVYSLEGRIFSVGELQAAAERWGTTEAEGSLCIGVDVAGEAGKGDASSFCARRGSKAFPVVVARGLSPEAHVTEILRLCARYPNPDPTDRPTVIVDRGGEPGSRVWGTLIAYRQTQWQDPPFRLVGVDSSKKPRNAGAYACVRDELVANLADWLRPVDKGGRGGAIPPDEELAAELHYFRWAPRQFDHSPNKLADKDDMRKHLGRSPDRADALALACYVERYWKPATASAAETPVEPAAAPSDMYDANAWAQGGTPGASGPAPGDQGDPWWPRA